MGALPSAILVVLQDEHADTVQAGGELCDHFVLMSFTESAHNYIK